MNSLGLSLAFLGLIFLSSCGEPQEESKSSSKPSEVEKHFVEAASKHKLPVRFLMAAGFLESNMSPEVEMTPYYQADSADRVKKVYLGTTLTETAFGLTRDALGISAGEEGDDLKVQIDAYAAWVESHLDKNLALDSNPGTVDDKYYWLWQLSRLHRNGEEQRRNIRVIWATDLMNILNEGRTWQDPKTGQTLTLAPENPPLDLEEFPADGRKWMKLETSGSDISNARMFELTNENHTELVNTPTHIKIIHCPLTLSACLELQDTTLNNPIALGAHFMVPQDEKLFAKALHLTQLDRPVSITDQNGKKQQITDAIVIMLVGNSGRYIEGIRKNADPTWFTASQLRKLGAVISGVCNVLSQTISGFDRAACQEPENKNGVHFQLQGQRTTYRWGDVPDFDKSIFYAYLRSSDYNIEGEAEFVFPSDKKTFKATDTIEFEARFPPGVTWIRLQRAMRCDDQQLVWETVRSDAVQKAKSYKYNIQVLDAGPNGNGRQFFRTMVNDEDNKLTAWAIDDLYVTGFNPKLFPPASACFLSDTRTVSDGN